MGGCVKELTKLEELVLIIIWKLGESAYGVNIKQQVNETTGKNYFYNTVYTAFDQLLRKGFITKHFGEPTAKRGGKRKVYFQITPTGITALQHAFNLQNQVWDGITTESFKQGLKL